jgi:2,3-bisphosphoglycerate-dependent phosphoglycerate mutase
MNKNYTKDIKYKVVFLRHGESIYNKNNIWGSWEDIDLSEEGIEESKLAGKLLKDFKFDICYTSLLKRTIKTWNIIAEELDLHYIDVIKNWRLNEKHYGNLMGLNKKQTSKIYGDDLVRNLRRDFSSKPPLLKEDDPRNPIYDFKYKFLPKNILPLGEVK